MSENWAPVPKVAKMLGKPAAKLREWAGRDEDPFPIVLPPGCDRGAVVYLPGMDEWLLRNGRAWRDVGKKDDFGID